MRYITPLYIDGSHKGRIFLRQITGRKYKFLNIIVGDGHSPTFTRKYEHGSIFLRVPFNEKGERSTLILATKEVKKILTSIGYAPIFNKNIKRRHVISVTRFKRVSEIVTTKRFNIPAQVGGDFLIEFIRIRKGLSEEKEAIVQAWSARTENNTNKITEKDMKGLLIKAERQAKAIFLQENSVQYDDITSIRLLRGPYYRYYIDNDRIGAFVRSLKKGRKRE